MCVYRRPLHLHIVMILDVAAVHCTCAGKSDVITLLWSTLSLDTHLYSITLSS